MSSYVKIFNDTVMCRRDYYTEFWFAWSDLLTQLGTISNYSAIADLHTFQFTVTHALEFLVLTSRILATDLTTVSLSLQQT
jgi:hypothetical protein